jgi:hypothetical protein
MRIVYLQEETKAAKPATLAQARKIRERILASLNAPVVLHGIKNVTYEAHVHRYTASFGLGGRAVTLQTSDPVAEFLTEHMYEQPGSWRGRMEDGILVDVCFIG